MNIHTIYTKSFPYLLLFNVNGAVWGVFQYDCDGKKGWNTDDNNFRSKDVDWNYDFHEKIKIKILILLKQNSTYCRDIQEI